MSAFIWTNTILWIVDLMVIVGLSFFYIWFARWYQIWQVWEINSNHLMNGETLQETAAQFQKVLELDNYEIFFSEVASHRPYHQSKHHKKVIMLILQPWPSLGYQLDYLISRLWLTKKESDHNKLIRNYKWTVRYWPWIWFSLICLCFIVQTIIFFLVIGNSNLLNNNGVKFLWENSLFSLLTIIFFAFWVFNFYLAYNLKAKVEQLYNNEIVGFANQILGDYAFDFFAARDYAQNLRWPFILFKRPREYKWLGPFVY